MPKQTKLLIYGALLFICWQVQSAEPFRYRGYIQQYLTSDPQYTNPAIVDWRRDYWAMGPSLNPSNSLAGWGGTRVSVQTFWGTPSSPFYLELPLLFYTRAVERGRNQLTMISNNFVLKTRSGPFNFAMSSKRVSENAQWSFLNLEDPLGALKLPNTSAPMLTMKLNTDVLGWDFTSYYLADHRTNFVPRSEEIPQRVFSSLGKTPEEMRFFDEIPTYRLLRGTKYTDFGTWGILWGDKSAVNINPRSEENDNTLTNPNHGIGYVKQNLGLDFTGQIPSLGGEITLAAVRATGEWYQYRKNELPDNLGTVSGDAMKLQLRDLKINSTTINSTYVMVEPGFQWTAVRDSRYAYVYGFLNPEKPQFYADGSSLYAYGWRAMRDDDFLLRDPEEKEEYLSDVSTYLGLRAWETSIKYPGKISISENKTLPALFSLELQDMENLRAGDHYYDPVQGEDVTKDYLELKINLETETPNSKVIFSARDRQYKDQDYFQELASGLSHNLTENAELSLELSIAKRLRDDVALPEGRGYRVNANLIGEMDSGLIYNTKLDYRAGNYDYGLLKSTLDRVLASPYTYWELNQYFEQNRTLNLGEIPIRGTIAAELTKRNSTLPEVSGTSLVAFGRGIAKVTSDLTATVTLINVSGPTFSQQKDKFPSNSLRDVVDCLFSYQLFGQRANTINFRFTRRYLNSGFKDNVLAEFVSRIGAHTLRFTLGRAPIGNRTSYIAGTKYDVRLNNLEKELLKRPWENWGTGGTLSDETFPYVVLNWSMPF